MSLKDNYVCLGQMSIFDIFSQDILYGKTSTEPSVPITERTSEQFSRKQSRWQTKMPMFLDLRKGKDGQARDVSWVTDIALLGECMTHNTGEYRSEGDAYVYSLTTGGATAPKILFELLGEAEYTEAHKTVTDFGEQSRSEVQPESEGLPWDTEQSTETRKGTSGTSEDSLGETSCAISFQERAGKPGGGKGILIQNERTGALSTLNNQSVFCIEGNGSRESHQGDGYKESDTMYTINTVEQHAVAYGYSQDAYDKFSENDKCASLKACGGTYGGGSEALVIQ